MSVQDLFFDALDISAVKAEHPGNLEGSEEVRGRRERRGDNGASDGSLEAQRPVDGPSQPQPPPPPRPQTPSLTAAPPPSPPPPASNPITASELRLAASAALRLAVEAIDALHGLKEVALEIADDVRELLEATRRAGGMGGARRTSRMANRRLGVRTRSQTQQRRQRWRS